MRLLIILLFFVSGSVLLNSCYYDKEDLLYGSGGACDTSTAATYSGAIAPMMNSYCATGGCHNTASASAGVILDNYNGVKTIASNGKLAGTINWASGFSPMPKSGNKLSSCNIAKIQQWINSGAPNN